MEYEIINPVFAGHILKKYMDLAGYKVTDIQKVLHLTCPQTIYRWINGERLPSVCHLYNLSRLFGVHMEELLTKKSFGHVVSVEFIDRESFEKRVAIYKKYLIHSAA